MPAARLEDRRVLITGAAGCIGRALAKAVSSGNAEELVLLDASEQGVYELEREFLAPNGPGRVKIALGNVCDLALLACLFERHQPHIVFHAAAFKHVPLLERNPLAAIGNNVFGTAELLGVAAEHRCEQLIFVSTDKAADPVSIMGASKRIAELTLLTHPGQSPQCKVVRLGNVLGSPGSIVPLFLEQIAAGIPMTVTHPEARRYLMTVDEAVAALVEAASARYTSGLFVPEMGPPVRITDLARHIFFTLHPERTQGPELTFIGTRPGDKLEEVLISAAESWASEDARIGHGGQLRSAIAGLIDTESFHEAMAELRNAIHQRQLARVLEIVALLVPGYRPSSVIAAGFESAATVSAGHGR